MAHIHGIAGASAFGMGNERYRRLLISCVLPVASLLALIGFGLFAVHRGWIWLALLCVGTFVGGILFLEKRGLALKQRVVHAETGAVAEQVVAEALHRLPEEYHVFHDLDFKGFNIDHVVVGPNGIFLIETKSQKGAVSNIDATLRKNGWPFFKDPLSQCWRQAYALRDYLVQHNVQKAFVTPVLCFSRASVDVRQPVRDIAVLGVRYLVPLILNQSGAAAVETRERAIESLQSRVSVQCSYSVRSDLPGPDWTGRFMICPKCRYERDIKEDAFVPLEQCPRCGVQYARALEAMQDAVGAKGFLDTLGDIPRASFLAALALKFVLPAVGALLLLGMIVSERLHHAEPGLPESVDANASSPALHVQTPPSSPPTIAAQPGAPGHGPAPVAKEVRSVQTPPPSPPTVAALSGASGQGPAPVAKEAPPVQTSPPSTPTVAAPSGASDHDPAPAAKEAVPRTALSTSMSGALAVSARSDIMVWFVDQYSSAKVGPFHIAAGSIREIVLPKGLYTVDYVQNGKHRQTSVSFVSQRGELRL